MGLINEQQLEPDPGFRLLPRRVVARLKLRAIREIRNFEPADVPAALGDAFRQLQEKSGGLRVRPYFSDLAQFEAARGVREGASPATTDLSSFISIECPHDVRPEDVVDATIQSGNVEFAYVEAEPAPPPVVTPGNDPLAASQGYLDAAPRGINSRWAWDSGVDGHGVGLIDIEYGWTLNHEDLIDGKIALKSGLNKYFRAHGTAVLGEMVATDNEAGCVGIAPGATTLVVSQQRSDSVNSPAEAILAAIPLMRPGDVLLLEMQSALSTTPYVPVEIEPVAFAAIKQATQAGIIVIEPAGNGQNGRPGVNLDSVIDVTQRHVLDRNSHDFKDSGAILVAAASADEKHCRMAFSNYGSRVDCFAWGEKVQTCGDGANGTSTTAYISGFGGTSAAAPIVAGAALLLQSWHMKTGQPPYTPAQMRELLSNTARNTSSVDPSSDQIGVMPDVRALIEAESAKPPSPAVDAGQIAKAAATFPKPVWLSYLALAALTIGNAVLPRLSAVPPPSQTSAAGPAVDFTTTTPLEMNERSGQQVRVRTFIRNDSDVDAGVKVEAVLFDHDGNILTPVLATASPIKAHQIGPVLLSFDLISSSSAAWDARLPARGFIRLTAKSEKKEESGETIKFRDLVIPQVQPARFELAITMVGLVVALALLVWALTRRAMSAPSADAPVWTPTSWSSNLAIGSALLTAVFSMAALPTHTHYMARASYSALTPFFAALLALAPAVYDLLKVTGSSTPSGGIKLFGFAAALTVWATLGELGTAGLLFLELSDTGAISEASAYGAVAVVAGVALVVVIYAFRTVSSYGKSVPRILDGEGDIRARRRWALL